VTSPTAAPAPTPPGFPAPIRATLADLPPVAAEAIRSARALPEDGSRCTVETDRGSFSSLSWGPAGAPPLLLVHGVLSSARSYWRIGPALAALGRRVVAIDLPGHGRTGGGQDGTGFGFAETAADVGAFARAALPDADQREWSVIGHSWGAMVAAHLPVAGFRAGRTVLLDPPVMDRAILEAMVNDPAERPDMAPGSALATVRAQNPDWIEGEQIVKAESLTQVVPAAAVSILLGNGDWDAGLAALTDATVPAVPTWIVRGEDAAGSLCPAGWLPRLGEAIGVDRVLTIAGGPHSPQRTHVEATTVALLRALTDR